MSHEAHHQESNHKPQAAGVPSVWFVLILVSLVIAAFNFVNIMSHDTEEGHEGGQHATEATHSTHAIEASNDAAAH